MKRGDLIVARGGNVGRAYGVEHWHARLFPRPLDWGKHIEVKEGTLGLVVRKLPPTGSQREWMLVFIDLHIIGFMCDGDGWELA